MGDNVTFEARCTFEEVIGKKMSKDECELIYNQIKMNNFT
jgi:hypothetical protein